jgi:hypothetical protein
VSTDFRSVLLGSLFTILILNVAALLPLTVFMAAFSILSLLVLGGTAALMVLSWRKRRAVRAAAPVTLSL